MVHVDELHEHLADVERRADAWQTEPIHRRLDPGLADAVEQEIRRGVVAHRHHQDGQIAQRRVEPVVEVLEDSGPGDLRLVAIDDPLAEVDPPGDGVLVQRHEERELDDGRCREELVLPVPEVAAGRELRRRHAHDPTGGVRDALDLRGGGLDAHGFGGLTTTRRPSSSRSFGSSSAGASRSGS